MRTISEIYDILATEKASFAELDQWVQSENGTLDNSSLLLADINSGSKVATWRLWLWIMAFGSWIIESLFDVHKSEVNTILATKAPHTLRWYAEESKKYQDGDEMEWNGNYYEYNPVELDHQIIKYAAASEVGNTVVLKVAKAQGASEIAALSGDELSRFTEFWSRWKDAGVMMDIVSLSPDYLKINITIVRDRLVLNSLNQLIRDTSVYPIENALDAFCKSLEFDGILRLSKLVDAIQAAEGVIDVKLNSALHKPAGGNYTSVDMMVIPAAGYFVIDVDSVYNYIDNINVGVTTG